MEGPADPLGGTDDSWDDVVLDEAFIKASPVVELSAEQRARLNRRRHGGVWHPESQGPLPPDVRPRRRYGRIARAWLGGMVVLAMLAGLAHWTSTGVLRVSDLAVGKGAAASDAAAFEPATGREAPSPSREARARPMRQPPQQTGHGAHRFLLTTPGGAPVGYDPCRPIHYVVNGRTAPREGRQLLREAIDRVSAATGLVFVDDGDTTESPSERRAAFQPRRYGDRWAPVLIAWSDPAEVRGLGGDVAGRGGSVPVSRPGSRNPSVYVTGVVTLDGPQIAQQLLPGAPALARAVVQHELGHLVGLDHVDDTAELMNPSTSELTDWGPGDREGLAALGRGRCFPDL